MTARFTGKELKVRKSELPSSQQPAASSQQPAAMLSPAALSFFAKWRTEQRRLVLRFRTRFPHQRMEGIEDAIEAAVELLLAKVIVFETAAELRSWLYVTSSYCILNDRRKNRRRAAIEEAEGIGFDDEATVAFVNRDLIDAALSILTEGDRELLLAKYESGISIVENARLTYTSVTRLQKRQQRALKRVRLRGKKLR